MTNGTQNIKPKSIDYTILYISEIDYGISKYTVDAGKTQNFK